MIGYPLDEFAKRLGAERRTEQSFARPIAEPKRLESRQGDRKTALSPGRTGPCLRIQSFEAVDPTLPLERGKSTDLPPAGTGEPRAIEDDDFPFEALSDIAEIESWRKEINRPIYHIHKWWAQRLGTVFRAIVIGAFAPRNADILELFYRPVRISDGTIFDPFMGSGTTVGEAAKLGARATGRDINPVAHFLVKNALAIHDRPAIMKEYRSIENDVSDRILRFYRTSLLDETQADVLYFFWVKFVECPSCREKVDLFSSYVFARHAYPKKNPIAHAISPCCGTITRVRYDAFSAQCASCLRTFELRAGPAHRQDATCPSCSCKFPIAKTIRKTGRPPSHRLYAKLVLGSDGRKMYLPITDEDRRLYAEAEKGLEKLDNPFPVVKIAPGYNTNQALGYNYRHWHEMFNARQLLCLSILASRIGEVANSDLRNLLTCLFSGALEFNNLFVSYKGEGTGAVRHMFAHHILKPERMPIEANVWGTPKSSGSFSTMFKGRIARALDYADNPFELRLGKRNGRRASKKVFGLSERIGFRLPDDYGDFAGEKSIYISCGDSSSTDLADRSVDAVLTDPPFFDNVHYSQLSDFFYVWQRHILGASGLHELHTTRSSREVQSSDVDMFTERLTAVLVEAHRVLKDEGILVFTYHHSRYEGWRAILKALMTAGFGITAVQPIKAEMSVAMPKRQAKEPIDLDIIVACRKRTEISPRQWGDNLWCAVISVATKHVFRFRRAGRRLGRNDVRIILMAQLVRQLSVSYTVEAALSILESVGDEIEDHIDHLHAFARDEELATQKGD